MRTTAAGPLQAFQWSCHPEAAAFVREALAGFLAGCPGAAALARRMRQETGTRFGDWVEALFLPRRTRTEEALGRAGYRPWGDRAGVAAELFAHPGGLFPRIGLHDLPLTAVHLRVTSVADFAAVWQPAQAPQGRPGSPYRRVLAWAGGGAELWAAERWGWTRFDLPEDDPARDLEAARTLDAFRTRRRLFPDPAEGFAHAVTLIEASRLEADVTCALWFEAEREYWQRRNRAAQVQRARQDRLGLGWGNHDHHTYRSSRRQFARLVGVWERLGFACRERFYAGREAGWGAQILEQPRAGIVTFNDVDLSPDELIGDFAHEGLPERPGRLGTVGLWCALHGEAFLEAGMHHLECQFDFEALRAQLEQEGVRTMRPFTDFPHLRQAFTEGERWPVREERIRRLLQEGQITEGQAAEFRARGALGSHLENLERNEGFKGFNQEGVSRIIAATDPRRHAEASRDAA